MLRIVLVVVVAFIAVIAGIYLFLHAGEDQAGGEPGVDNVPAISKIKEAYENNAIAAGRAAAYAQRIKFTAENRYAASLAELRAIDKSITSDPDVIFVFGDVSEAGFTFTTSHARGERTYVFK